MENNCPPLLADVAELRPPKAANKTGWYCFYYDMNSRRWEMGVYFKKKEVPPGAIEIHRCRIYVSSQ